jgi:hypothetical protein
MRNVVFISHANPEDNGFALWLSMQLMRHGYDVWCDLTKLPGGERFWQEIEQTLRHRCVKCLYVLSKTSNRKQGPLDELQVALNTARDNGLHQHVIPLHIDDLPFREIDIRLSQINAIEFAGGWATGLSSLLKRLEEDAVPRDPDCGAQNVSQWWRRHRSGEDIVVEQQETLLSNWFPAQNLPRTLYVHHEPNAPATEGWTFKHPAHGTGGVVISFATAEQLGITASRTDALSTRAALDKGDLTAMPIERRELGFAVQRLVRDGWQRFVASRGLPTYSLSNDRVAAYFPASFNEGKMYRFSVDRGRLKGRRGLTGMARGNHWHFGLSADFQLLPDFVLVTKSHVLFSEDGQHILESTKRLHSLRRSACKGWWNDYWRDRLLAAMHWLADGKASMPVPLAPDLDLDVRVLPTLFRTPVTYQDQAANHAPPDLDDFDDEDGDSPTPLAGGGVGGDA